MFKFLKQKFKDAVKKFAKEAEEIKGDVNEKTEEKKETSIEESKKDEKGKKEEVIEETTEVEEEPTKEEPEIEEDVTEEEVSEEIDEELEEPEKEVVEEEPKKESFRERLKKKFAKKISSKKFEELFDDLELSLLEANVAVEVIEKIKSSLKEQIVDVPIKGKVEDFIILKLKESVEELFDSNLDLLKEIKKSSKPYIILFLGVNGSGKTTTIAKVASLLKENKLSCVLAAADTFRAAAIDQLMLHGNKLGVKVIKHDYGSDAAAVAFDAIKHAKSKEIDVVLIDTAGRMHSNKNLMDELKKVSKVSNPNLKVFVGESIVGNDAIEQAKTFNDIIDVNGIILTKADVDEKGGTAISISYVIDKPILFLGTGQSYGDLEKFNLSKLMESLGF